MTDRYSPGDLVYLNQYGIFVTSDFEGIVAVVISQAYSMLVPFAVEEDYAYRVYDILLNGELLTMVPEDFMESYKKNEKDNK